jgi:peptidoglycan hydrolase-like protein with peptidoglycan-binding domain
MTAGRKADAVTLRAAEIWTEGMSLYVGPRTRAMVRQYQRQLW